MAVQRAFEGSTSETKSVTVLSVDTYTRNIILPAYSNVRAEVNQIFRLQFCPCANSPVLYCCKNEENQCNASILYMLLKYL